MKNRVIVAAVAIVALIAIASTGVYYSSFQSGTSTATVTQNSILASDPTPYFPTGYESKTLNLSSLANGNVISVAQIPFQVEFPSNIETRTTAINGSSTTITVTADYQCGISLGQRKFFHAQLPNGNDMKLDYCLILNTAVGMAERSQNMSMSWNLWQISLNTYPTVALHMRGAGENVVSAELWVSTYTSTSTSTESSVNVFGLVSTLGSGTSATGVVFTNVNSGEVYYAPIQSNHFSIYLPNQETYSIVTKWAGSYYWQQGEVDSGSISINKSQGSSMALSCNLVELTPNSNVTIMGSISTWQMVTAQPVSVKFTSLDGSVFSANVSTDRNFTLTLPNFMTYEVNIGAQNSSGYIEWFYAHNLVVSAGLKVTGLLVDVAL